MISYLIPPQDVCQRAMELTFHTYDTGKSRNMRWKDWIIIEVMGR